MDDFNLEKLSLPPDFKHDHKVKKSLPKHKPGEYFLKGPVPWAWITASSRLPGKALHVGTAIWFLAGMKNQRTVTLPGKLLMDMGIERNAGYRALNALEKAGLVSVSRHQGRRPTVTINDVPENYDQLIN